MSIKLKNILLLKDYWSGNPRHRRDVWLLVFGLLVVLRLFLSGDRDILALNSPYDEYWFVHSAAKLVWGGNYSQLAFAHLPIYSMWLAALSILGIPARLGIDLAWLAATAYASFALFRLTGARWVGVLFWLFCAFNPLFFVLFDRALAETLLCVLVVLLLGSGLEVWATRYEPGCWRARVATWVFMIGFALAFHVRKEGVLLLVPLLVLGAYSWVGRKAWWRRQIGAALAGRLIVLPLVAVVGLGCVLAGANYLRWGLAIRYELAAPGYVQAMSALNRIDVGRGPLHVTVTAKAREAAYAHSPTFRELQSFFEGEQGRQLAAHTAQFSGHHGEIGNGWFYWALRDAGAVAGWHTSAREADKKYAAVAAELEEAFRVGRLKSHPALFSSFLDPDFDKWVGRIPSSSWAALGLVLESRPGSVQAAGENATPKQFAEFVEVAGRRNPLPSVGVRGWIVVPVGSSLGLTQAGKEPGNWSVAQGPARPDVPGGLPFSLTYSGVDLPDQLVVRTTDGKAGSVAISDLREGGMTKTAGDLGATLGVDELSTGARASRLERWLSYANKRPVRLDWLGELGRLYGWLNVVLVAMVFLALIRLVIGRQSGSPLMAVLLVVGAALVARASLFGVLDASSWNGVQARYMAPLIPAFALAGSIAVWVVLGRAQGDAEGMPSEKLTKHSQGENR